MMSNPNTQQDTREANDVPMSAENEEANGSATEATPTSHVQADPSERAPQNSKSRRQRKKEAGVRGEGRGDSIAGTLIVCAFLVVMVMGYFLNNRVTALESVTASAADSILIIDYQSLFANLPEDVTGEAADKIFMDVQARILALQEAGYIVLDANAVLAAPTEMRIDGSLLLSGEL